METHPEAGQSQDERRPHNRFEPVFRLVLYFFALLVVYLVIGVLYGAVILFTGTKPIQPTDFLANLPLIAGMYAALAIVTVFITLAFVVLVDRRPVSDLGLDSRGPWQSELLFGMILGLAATGLMFAISYAAGWTHVTGFGFRAGSATSIALAFLLMVAIALLEETMMRGYVMRTLKWGYGAVPALVVSSMIFGSLHFLNPGAALPGYLGTTAAGLVLGYSYLVTGRLWLPIGFHFAWNFFLGPVFGFPVSGIELESLVRQTTQGSALWSGGEFGPEAGLLSLGVLILCAAAVWWFGKALQSASRPFDTDMGR